MSLKNYNRYSSKLPEKYVPDDYDEDAIHFQLCFEFFSDEEYKTHLEGAEDGYITILYNDPSRNFIVFY